MTLRYIALEKLVIPPNRQRQEHDIEAHQELIASISKLGLLHPPVLRVVGEDYVLVAGERRVRAMADMIALGEPIKHGGVTAFLGMIPYTYFGDLSALEAEEAELDENIKRKDLTWQERAVATSRLAALARNKLCSPGYPPLLGPNSPRKSVARPTRTIRTKFVSIFSSPRTSTVPKLPRRRMLEKLSRRSRTSNEKSGTRDWPCRLGRPIRVRHIRC